MTISGVTQTIATPAMQGATATGSGASFKVPPTPLSPTGRERGAIRAFNPYQSLSADLQSSLLAIQDRTSPTDAAGVRAGASGGGTNR